MRLFYRTKHKEFRDVYFCGLKLFTYKKKPTTEYEKIFFKRYDGLTEKEARYILETQFKKVMGYDLNLDNPQTFNEKLQWLKLYYRDSLMTKCADKYKVREYIKEKIGEEYLISILGVWNNPDEIDFEQLPNQFVLKVNWGSGQNIIVKDKSKLNIKEAKEKLKIWMRPEYNHYYTGLEWCYKDIKPKIICEKYIQQLNGDLYDYKFMCYNGKVENLFIVSDRFKHKYLDWYDKDYNFLKFERLYHNSPNGIPKPKNFEKLKELAEKLAKPFPFVRVDFYTFNDGIYFGELTFYPGNGMEPFNPQEWDLKLGNLLELKGVKNG